MDCLCNYYNEKFNNTLIKCLTGNFLKNNAKLDEILKNEEFMDLKLNRTSEYIFYIKRYFEYVYKFCLDYKNINFIIEGTQLFMTLNPLFFKDKPLIVIRESSLKCLFKRLKRELKEEEKRHPLKMGKKYIKKLLNDSKRLHFKDLKKLNNFIYAISNR